VGRNTEIVAQLVEAFNERDFRRAERLYAHDYVNRAPAPFAKHRPESLGTSGMIGLVEILPDARSEIVQLVEKGDLVVLHTLVRGRNQDGDVAAEFVNVFRLENERICESWGLVDALDIMRQLGVEPVQARAEA
jgi:predicted SnoaL-like aldol condensation-catalyzing enzyme